MLTNGSFSNINTDRNNERHLSTKANVQNKPISSELELKSAVFTCAAGALS